MQIKKIFMILIIMIFSVSGCGTQTKSANLNYTKITANEAKEMMNGNNAVTILDVRTEEEYKTGHIKGAILIPDTEITNKAKELLTNKSATIMVYCRSGRRSANAAAKLIELGYTNVYDFGGIIDWKYDTVTE